LSALILLARRRLPAIVGAGDAAQAIDWLRRNGANELAAMDCAAPPAPDLRGKALRRVALSVVALHHALAAALGRENADDAARRVLHPLIGPVFKLSMRPLPRGPRAFETFKRRYEKANRPLTLMTWSTVEDTPTTFQADFSRCGLAEITAAVGAPEVCRLFCEYDEVFFSAYDPRLRFMRRETIAGGGQRCTFRFEWSEPGLR
jgi:hypothetical protein